MGKKGKKGGGGGGKPPGEAATSDQPEQQRQQPQQQRQQQPQQPQQQQQRQQQAQQQQQRQPQPQQQQQSQPQPQQQQQRQPQPQQQQQRQPQPQQHRQQQPQQWQQQSQPWQQQPQQQHPQQRQQQPQQQQPQQQPRQQQPQQQQRSQDAPQDFPPPGAGDFTSKKNKRKGRQQQEPGSGPGAAPPQQTLQQSQPVSPQQHPPEQRMQQPPGFPISQVRQAAPITRPQVVEQQRPPRPAWGQPQQQPQQAPFPLQAGPRGQPSPWGQRGPPPQQVSQPPSRETTPTYQTRPPPQQLSQPQSRETTPTYQTQPPPQQQPVPPVTRVPPARQQPADPQPVRPPPSQPQPQPQQAPQPRTSPPGGRALEEKMRSLDVNSFIPPKRKDRPPEPKKGRGIVVETNHLNLNIKNKDMVIHHYDVSINPEKPYRNYRQAVEAVRKRCFKNRFPAFDGKKNLYSYPELPLQKSELVETVTIYDAERDQEKEMTVTIKYATQVNVSTIWEYLRAGTSTNTPQEAIQALDIVLRQPAANRFVTVGRSFFSPPPGKVIDLGYGLDLWYGFFQSAIIGWKPFLNIDVAHKGFPAADWCVNALSKFIRDDVNNPRLQLKPYEMEAFDAYIKDLKVVYEIPAKSVKRTYKVNKTTTCPRDNRFEVVDKDTNNKSETTVERYFLTQYNVRLKYAHLPCLVVGSRDKPLSLPMELCTIVPGQVTMKKMNDAQTRTMVKEAAVDTERRKQKIVKSIGQINFNSDPCLREFGLSVDDQFTKVNARIMNAPTVDYREREVIVRQGVWRNEKFIQGAELVQWRIVNTNPMVREPDLRKLATELINHGKDCGMNISNNYKIEYKNGPRDLEQYFSQCLKEDVKLVIVVLPDRGMTYANIKKIAELQVGILTQCLKSITVQRRLNAATFVNILQKINAKLNGVNHQITHRLWPSFFKKPVIVVGADVTHPAPDQINVPSIAAVAASYDPRAFRYNMIWKLQPPREEVIRDLESIMKEQLLMFYRNTSRQKPQAILFYRDGVSEGQFKIILNQELTAIRRACSSLSADYNPPITFIVVQKRHHTRFFPDKKDADGRNMNVPAGTVVDTDITHPTELDFYLVSHASIQGTARPTKYHLLWDDSDLSEQVLEEITYYLCHLFTRCTRSVSYPAPTYYAHLAAFRARAYTDADRLQLNHLEDEQNRRRVKDSVCKSNPMFFV